MANDDKSRVVRSVGVSVNSATYGRDIADYLQKVMADEVLKCNQEGISTEEKNASLIRGRMLEARQQAIDEIYVASQPKGGNGQ